MSSNGSVDLNISASEESKGGVKYEVVLSQPVVDTPPRTISPTHGGAKPIVTVDKIEQKLKHAAERRQSMESEKLASLQEKFKKIDEAAKLRAEEESNFINATKENLEQKMKAHIDNRETIIADLKVKLSQHNNSHLQEVRQNLESSMTEFEEKAKEELLKKLEIAEQKRESLIQERLEILKKHEEKVEQVRTLKRSASQVGEDNGCSMDESTN
jgi:exonuclease VII large subunit